MPSRILGMFKLRTWVVAGAIAFLAGTVALTRGEAPTAAADVQAGAPGAKPAAQTGRGAASPETSTDALANSVAVAERDRAWPWLDAAVWMVERLVAAVVALVGGLSWQLAAVLIFFFARTPLMALIDEIRRSMSRRPVDIEIGQVKVKLHDLPDDAIAVIPVLSPSPFEFGEDGALATAGQVQGVPPQLLFHASDYVAKDWEKRDAAGRRAVTAMDDAYKALITTLEMFEVTVPQVKPALITYARALEAARFRLAPRFAALIAANSKVRKVLEEAKQASPPGPDHVALLHAAAVASGQAGDWQSASDWLKPIAWKDDAPLHPQAAVMWLAAAYQSSLSTPQGPADPAAVAAGVTDLLDKGDKLLKALETDVGWAARGLKSPRGFYLREVYKDLGAIASIVAEYAADAAAAQRLFDRAAPYLIRCTETLEGEAASAIDYNNLADFYRQLGDAAALRGQRAQAQTHYAAADEQMMRVFAATRPGDPAFHNTAALLYQAEGRHAEALRVLAEYSSDLALSPAADRQDREQYLDNQILAARLTVGPMPTLLSLTQARAILMAADSFLDRTRGEFTPGTCSRLLTEILQLLAFAELQLPNAELAAALTFGRLFADAEWKPAPLVALRARIGRARARGRAARVYRRRAEPQQAAAMRESAVKDAAEIVKALDNERLEPDAAAPRTGLWIDATRALLLLAEEELSASELGEARKHGDAAGKLLMALDAVAVAAGADGPLRIPSREQSARLALLDIQLLRLADPDLDKAETITTVRSRIAGARGFNARYESLADLALASLLLRSVQLRRGDPPRDYDAAVMALERASERDVPSLRGEIIRELARAYGMRVSVRPAPASEG